MSRASAESRLNWPVGPSLASSNRVFLGAPAAPARPRREGQGQRAGGLRPDSPTPRRKEASACAPAPCSAALLNLSDPSHSRRLLPFERGDLSENRAAPHRDESRRSHPI